MISSYTMVCEIPRELKSVLKNTLKKLDFVPTLAFGFVSSGFPLSQIMDDFQAQKIRLFGATSAGVISFHEKEDRMLDKGALFVLTNIPAQDFRLELLKRDDAEPAAFGKEAGKLLGKPFKSPTVLAAFSGLGTDVQAVLNNLQQKNKTPKMFGFLAGDDLIMDRPMVFTEREMSDDGAVFLILNEEKIRLQGMTTSGWNGLGSDFTVTRSEGNEVLEMDQQPALDFYMNYLNISEDDLPLMGLEYPLMIRDQKEKPYFRSITKINKQRRSLIFACSLPAGTQFSFAASPGFEILEKTREKVIEFHENHSRADLMLLFSSVARRLAVGPLINTEIKLASIKWKTPLAGCFSYGEIATENGLPPQFYNQSFTLALLEEIPVLHS